MTKSVAIALLLALTGSASADFCERWNSGLSYSDVSSGPWTWEGEMNYRKWLYADTALDACKKKYKKGSPNYTGPVTATILQSNPNWASCHIDGNGDGTMSRYEATTANSFVDRGPVTKDECCTRSPAGPLKDYPAANPPLGEGYFTDAQKDAARNATIIAAYNPPKLRSHGVDAGLGLALDYWTELAYNQSVYYANDDSPAYLYISADAAAELDHIIPRKDSNGCPCGDNSWANMQVISRKLNREMSNNCQHPARQQFLQKYTNP